MMSIYRIMSYYINGGHDAAGVVAPLRCADIIRRENPDLVFLQRIGSPIGLTSIGQLAEEVGLEAYGPDAEGGCAYLSRYQLRCAQVVPLGSGSHCVRAELIHDNERLHLFNLSLSFDPWQRREQLHRLADCLLCDQDLGELAIIAGDFGLPLWGSGEFSLNKHLQRAGLPLWRGNFPVNFPLIARDRIYFRGAVRSLSGQVLMNQQTRKASTHLPLVMTIETREIRSPIRVKEINRLPTKRPNPVCG
jgi:endonuclease/exonuclease/phosphatase family metal-dependent hydrolase